MIIVRIEELSWPEFDRIKDKVVAVILPVGSVEAHGRHLPLGTDVFAPLKIAELVEQKVRERGKEVLVMPPIWYGHSFALNAYPGTINVRPESLRMYVGDVLAELAAEGFKKIVLLNGHGGNVYPLTEAAEDVAELYPDVEVYLINWWLDFREDILSVCSGQGHAGEDETSVMLAIRPELVNMREARGRRVKRKIRVIKKDIGKEVFPDGLNDDPSSATAEKGERILQIVSESIARIILGEEG
ncbi:Creatinine amidohydrolase (creatininase) [Thermococcus gammatolerans EJ3]|uniref:Creatinine amidohydrolase (Creatininase) n=1 Tax=Thermococcus gammatolerans (strain DSM 15229 / JCM 11827 / EJ3) TaxID=593117 RepID=C5A4C5_THEGJ|nr:Creatinine amidohydrolase (creatininase) [Thermococcus gammatolerans EJ3]